MTKLTMKMKMRMTIISTKPTINQMSVTHLGSIHLLKFLFTSIGCLSGYWGEMWYSFFCLHNFFLLRTRKLGRRFCVSQLLIKTAQIIITMSFSSGLWMETRLTLVAYLVHIYSSNHFGGGSRIIFPCFVLIWVGPHIVKC